MITSLFLRNFRNFDSADLRFESKSIVVCGGNGQGKTSLLESIFYLGNLRSFRTSKIRELRKLSSPGFEIQATLKCPSWNTALRIFNDETRKLSVDGQPVYKASDFTGRFRTIAFLPDDPDIITGSSLLRRRFFDMFISMLDSEYFTALQTYSNALKARNFLIRTPNCDSAVLASYTPLLAHSGSVIVALRNRYAALLSERMSGILSQIRPQLGSFSIHPRALKGMEQEQFFANRIELNSSKDFQKGFTSIGPHLDDFDFCVNSRNLRMYGSRGQCRIVSFALKLAEYEIVQNADPSGEKTIVMIDDATGDLDPLAKAAFYDRIHSAGQIFYTFTALDDDFQFIKDSQIITINNGTATRD